MKSILVQLISSYEEKVAGSPWLGLLATFSVCGKQPDFSAEKFSDIGEIDGMQASNHPPDGKFSAAFY